jgi:hypothetical protein
MNNGRHCRQSRESWVTFNENQVFPRLCLLRNNGFFLTATRVARFFLVQNTKTGENIPNLHELYQISIKYNKRPQNGLSVYKIYQHLTLQDPLKFTQIRIFGLKTNHLATLTATTNVNQRRQPRF